MSKSETTVTSTEVITDDWSLAKQLFDQIKLNIRLSLAGQACLGAELLKLKKELGFKHGGSRKGSKVSSGQVGHLKKQTWEEWLKQEMPDLPVRTGNRFISVYEAARSRLKRLGHTKALALFDQPACELSEQQHEQLIKFTNKITDGHTQSSLLQELKIVKLPQGSAANGGDLSQDADGEDKNEATMQDVAFALFTHPAQELCKLRASSDYKSGLHALPLTSSDETTVTLSSLEQQTTSFLADIQEAKEAAARDAKNIAE